VIRTIMVAVNDSSAAFGAAAVAVDLATALGARLVAVSVVDGPQAEDPTLRRRQLNGPDETGAQLAAVDAAQRHLRTLADRAGLELDLRTVRGRVADELLEQARHLVADLVVVGRTDRTGVRLGHVGRTAEEVLEFCEVPVLVVPATRPSVAPCAVRPGRTAGGPGRGGPPGRAHR
jgi:nucleotide-binding universal stress UspA family protein